MVKDFRIKRTKSPIVSLNIDSQKGEVNVKIHKNKASIGQIKRWETARKKKKVWDSYSPGSNISIKQFANKKNIFDENIEIYDMSVQVDYVSNKGGLYVESQTFKVIAFKGLESKNQLDTHIKSAYGNMVFKDSGDTFNPQFQSEIEKNTKIDYTEIRGLEEDKQYKLEDDDYLNLATGRYIIKDLNPNLKASKNKGKSSSRNSKTFNVKLDLTEFV